MHKKTLWKILLILLPVAAVALAGMPESVKMIQPDGSVKFFTFFDYVPDSRFALCPFLTVVTASMLPVMAALYLLTKQSYWLAGIKWVAIASVLISELPMIATEERTLFLNVFVSILMALECALAVLMHRSLLKDGVKTSIGSRLKVR